MTEHPSRKLAVILHADVVGSTTLVQRNEALAHGRILDVFHRFSETIRAYGGTPHELRGDALLAEFSRASDAVSASLSFQVENAQHNKSLDEDICPEIRIGLSLGEVIVADGTLTGSDVVLAQRLEQLATPGGVCVDLSLREAVPSRLPFDYNDLGEHHAKGFDHLVRAFAVSLSPGGSIPEPERRSFSNRLFDRPMRQWLGAVAVTVVIVAGGGVWWWQTQQPEFIPADPAKMVFPLPEKPSIAVLPFDNLSGEESQQPVVDGLTENIIAALSRVTNLFVIDRHSALTYKDRSVPVQQVAEEQGVRYVLEGSVQGARGQLRITVHLMDAIAGNPVWGERYDRDSSDFFALQDEITLKIVEALQVKLTEGEAAQITRRGTDNLQAWLLRTQSRQMFQRFTREDNVRSRDLALKAIELDPAFSGAYTRVGWTHWIDAQAHWSENPTESLERAIQYAQIALDQDQMNPDTYRLMAAIHLLIREHDLAINYSEKSISLSPNHSTNVAFLGFVLNYAGDPERSIVLIKDAMRLSPYYADWYLGELGRAYYLTGRYDLAVDALEQRLLRSFNNGDSLSLLAATYAQLGRKEDANAALEAFLDPRPHYTQALYAKGEYYRNERDLKRVLDGLAEAGLPP